MDRRHFLSSTGLAAIGAGLAVGAPALAQTGPASQWQIGPVIRGRNYSVGMPPSPYPAGRGFEFDFPGPTARHGHVHYLTRRTGSLAGARAIRLQYRIDARPGARFVPQEQPERAGTLSLFFQRAGDDWSGRGDRAFYRWYSPQKSVVMLKAGTHTMTIPLEAEWVSVSGGLTRSDAPRAFEDALRRAERVGFVFGSSGRRGHGVYTTAPARFTVLDFSII